MTKVCKPHYLILKKNTKDLENENYDASVKFTLSLAIGVSEDRIRKCDSWFFTNKDTIFKQYINRQASEDMPIWHYLNYLKGFRDAQIWSIDSEITGDKLVIKYYKNLYGGVVDRAIYPIVEEFVLCKIRINALNKALEMIKNKLLIEKCEEEYLIDSINVRIKTIELTLKSFQFPLIKRDF